MTRPYEIVYIFESALEEQQIDEHLARFHPVLEVAIEPVGLLDQDDADPWVCLQEGRHLAEAGPPGARGDRPLGDEGTDLMR